MKGLLGERGGRQWRCNTNECGRWEDKYNGHKVYKRVDNCEWIIEVNRRELLLSQKKKWKVFYVFIFLQFIF